MFNYQRRSPYLNNGYSGQMMYGNPLPYHWDAGVIRIVPYPNHTPFQNSEWHSYLPQNPYYPQQYQPINQDYQPYQPYQPYIQQIPLPAQPAFQKDSQFLFKNPLQPEEELLPYNNFYPQTGGLINPYPKPNLMANQPGGMQSLMNSFKSQDGSVDFNKMMNAAGQMMNAVTQMTSLVKGLGGMFKP